MHELKSAASEASSILIVLPDDASDRDYLAALQLQKIAPEKTHIVAPEEKESLWSEVFGTKHAKKEFAIVVDTAVSPVDELRYEKDNGKLTILLAHKQPFRKEAVRFEEYIPAADLVVTIGFVSEETAEKFIGALPRKGSQRHIWLGGSTVEKISLSQAGLLGRLMARSREDNEIGALWSFITKDDFSKTRSSAHEIPGLVRAFAEVAALPRAFIVFWQAPDTDHTDGILWSREHQTLARAAEMLGQALRSEEQFITLPRYGNFIEAESSLRKLLHTLG